MIRHLKTRLALFVVALTLAMTGLLAQTPSAYAGTGVNPPSRPRSVSPSEDPWLHAADWLQPHGLGNNPPRP